MKASTALALLLTAGLAAPLGAQQQQGDLDLQFSGSVLTTVDQEGGNLTSGLVQSRLAYFVSDHVQLGAFPSVFFARTTVETPLGDQTISDTRFGMGLFGNYSFLTEGATTVPYVGGQLYRIDVTDEDETGWLGATGGLKVYLNRTTALDVGGNFLLGIGESDGALMLLQAGLNFLL